MTAIRKTRSRTSLFDARLLVHITSWVGVTLSVRLCAGDLAAGRIPPLAVGDVHGVAPALCLSDHGPVADVDEYFSDDDPVGDWWCGETATFCARAVVVPPVLDRELFVLDIAGRGFPLVSADPALAGSHVIEARGDVSFDPRLDVDGVLASVGDSCRQPMRLTALRRYAVDDDGPHDPAALDRVPASSDVQEASLYVADFVGTEQPR